MLRLSGLALTSMIIMGCATAPSEQRTAVKAPQISEDDQSPADANPMNNIIKQFEADNNLQSLQQSLLSLAGDYQKRADCVSTDNVIAYSLPIFTSEVALAKANILRSECAIFQAQQFAPGQLLSQIATRALLSSLLAWQVSASAPQALDTEWQTRLNMIDAYIESLKGNFSSALNGVLGSDMKSSPLAPLQEQLAFSWFASLTDIDRTEIIERYPRLFQYQRLLSIIEDKTINDAQRQQQLLALISQAQPSGEFRNLPQQVSHFLSLTLNRQEHMAVLLPLSGRLESQGQAIKQGVLAGYYAQYLAAPQTRESGSPEAQTNVLNLTFIDTGSELELSNLVNKETLQPYSTLVGPLLKSHVESIQAIAPAQSRRLYLNQLEPNSINTPAGELGEEPLVHFFALSPEQEAQQLAMQMQARNIQHPVLIHDDSIVTSRMAESFLQTWKQYQTTSDAIAPSQVKYADNKSMRVGITSALDVLQSQQRINQMSNLISEQVHSVTRNRRDVDAFVVFARPNEVELINPIIESSMSFFTGQQIPVFATSYSYNHKQNRNSLRDLRNLVFVDMPFIVPEGRQTVLANEVDRLFNEPSSTFLRLFAFGYDAISLTQQIVTLGVFNHLDSRGLTGVLSIQHQADVTRELSTLSINTED